MLLYAAQSEMMKLVVPRDLERLAHHLGRAYADLVYNGRWFTPTREAIDAFMQTMQSRITGSVRLKLFKGDCRVAGRPSPLALDPPAPPRGFGEAGETAPPATTHSLSQSETVR